MNKTKQFLTAVLIVVFFSVSLTAQPFMGRQKEHRMPKHSPTKIYMMLKAKQKDFNITDSQLEQIKNKVFALEEKIIPMKSKNELHRLEMKKLMLDEKNKDYGKIKAAMTRMSENRQAIFIEGLRVKDAINSILTPGQQEAIKEARQNRFKKGGFFRKGMKGKMPHRFSSLMEPSPRDFDFQQEQGLE